MSTSREAILGKIRQHLPQAVDPPQYAFEPIRYDDPIAKFREVLEGVGGACEQVASAEEANARLKAIPQYAEASKTCSHVEGVGQSTFDPYAVDDPRQLEDVDFAVLPGYLAVAENAAIWVTDEPVSHRVLYFLPQHLALVVPADQVVSNMHEAYERIEVGTRPLGTFIAGPSKTADIEQSLVIGAHGARSLTVFLVEG
ncbi:MAG: lactate utilization protein C [Maioricimonas sp. JB045]|uniref:LutC/YkgG family protein n=1 Tax=Maioricimonas sp. JC845 TaxID=3232138 RepID=UPI00345A4023